MTDKGMQNMPNIALFTWRDSIVAYERICYIIQFWSKVLLENNFLQLKKNTF